MINKDDNQPSTRNSIDAQLILKALNTNWRIKIDNNIHKKVLKYINGHFNRSSTPYIFSVNDLVYSVNDLVDYYSQDFFAEVDDAAFEGLKYKEKEFFCMVYMSTLYTKWLINDFDIVLSKKKDGLTYNLEPDKMSDSGDAGMKRMLLAMAIMMAVAPDRKQDHSIDINIKEYSSTPLLSRVFEHLIQIKHSFSLLLEIFYRIISQMELSIFDYKTYNTLNDSVAEENYEQFRDIIYGWDANVISGLSIILEQLYPIFLFLEINISKQKQNILDCIRYYLTERSFAKSLFNRQPITIETSLTSFILVTIINYLVFNFLDNYLNQDASECIDYFWPQNDLTTFHRDYKIWIDENMKMQLYFFQNTAGVRLIDDSQTIINNELEEGNEDKNHITQDQANHDSKRQQELGSSGENDKPADKPQNRPKDSEPEPPKIPDYIKVPCGQRMLEKLINGLINGHKDETLGNFTPLITSKTGEDREAIKMKLICLFTGEGINDESIKWPYDLKWNDKANSLKLLVYLLHYEGIIIDPLDEKEGAIDKNDVEGINKKIRTEFLGKNVWAIVGPALGYGENTLRNKNKIPKQSNLSLMKKLAQFWFECKKLDD